MILRAKEIEKRAMEDIPEGRNDIKAHSIEGEIFASIYEGYTSYSIKNILPKGNDRVVKLEFVLDLPDLYGPKVTWIDDVKVVNENGWKLDNVVYEDRYLTDLQKLLSDFILEYEVIKNVHKNEQH